MTLKTPIKRIQVFLRKDVNSMDIDDCTDKDIRDTLLPDGEVALMLNDLNDAFVEQGLLFDEFEEEIYSGDELKHAMEVVSQYKERLPVLYTEIKRAYDLDTVALIYL